MKNQVTKAMIEAHSKKSQRIYDFEGNPVAMCLIELGLENVYVNWGTKTISFSVNGTGYIYSMPPEVHLWLRAYDNYLPVDPFEFELEIPSSFVKLAA